MRQTQLVAETTQFDHHRQRCVTGTQRMILVRDRCSEQRHDAITGVLVDGALEAMNTAGQDAEEAIKNAVPFFRVHLLGQFLRTFHVREQHRHALALALDSGTRGKNFVSEVPRRVVARSTARQRGSGFGGGFRSGATLIAETGLRAQFCATAMTAVHKRRGASFAELRLLAIGVAANGTVQAVSPSTGRRPAKAARCVLKPNKLRLSPPKRGDMLTFRRLTSRYQ